MRSIPTIFSRLILLQMAISCNRTPEMVANSRCFSPFEYLTLDVIVFVSDEQLTFYANDSCKYTRKQDISHQTSPCKYITAVNYVYISLSIQLCVRETWIRSTRTLDGLPMNQSTPSQIIITSSAVDLLFKLVYRDVIIVWQSKSSKSRLDHHFTWTFISFKSTKQKKVDGPCIFYLSIFLSVWLSNVTQSSSGKALRRIQ